MRTRFIGIIIAIAFCLIVSTCGRKASAPLQNGEIKRYELKGKVVEVDQEKKRLKVDHEAVKDFMAPMTMWFAVKDDANFSQVQVGAQLTATLMYNPNDNRFWLENLSVMQTGK
jgi:Cu/Ag efflux protein CusF